MLPSGARELTARGHRVIVQRGAGAGAAYRDEEYRAAGAEIVETADAVFSLADLIVKVKEPQPDEVALLSRGTSCSPTSTSPPTGNSPNRSLATGCTAIAYETIEVNGRLPLLEPMSEIAGRMSVDRRRLPPRQTPRRARRPARRRARRRCPGASSSSAAAPPASTPPASPPGSAPTSPSSRSISSGCASSTSPWTAPTRSTRAEASLLDLLPRVDLLIGAVLVPGAKAPKLITREMLKSMQPGSVFVDIAVDQGGCAETTRPTTHDDPTFVEEEVIHYCVANMPGAYARTATQALNNVTHPYLNLIADQGLAGACEKNPSLLGGINCYSGKLTCRAVAEAHGMEFSEADLQQA